MGNYASQSDLKARYEDDAAVAELTFDSASGTPDASVLDEAILDAEGQIDSYVANRYKIPVDVSSDTTLAARMKNLTLDLACYALELRSGKVTEDRVKARDDAIEYLVRISRGEALLPSATAPDTTESRASLARYGTAGDGTSSRRVFTRDTQEAL